MFWNAVLVALQELRRNLLRSSLTVLGVVIGVGAVITLVTLGNGATRAVSDQISSLGSNLLIVRSGQRLAPGRESGSAPSFDLADVEAIREQVPGLVNVAPTTGRQVTAVHAAESWSTQVVGTNQDYFAAGNWELAAGRFFGEAEERAGKAVCVLGETVRQKLFRGESPLGGKIRLKQLSCEVIGVLGTKGQGALGSDQDDLVVLPLRTVQRRLAGSTEVTGMQLEVASTAGLERAKQAVERLLRERRQIGAGEEDDFQVLDTRQIADTLSSTIRLMTSLLGAVAAVSLLVGGIGIMNILLVSVTERTREIGTRLAIGALEREVLLQFLVEAVVVSTFGGLVGIVLATSASYGLAALLGLPFLLSTQVIVGSFVFSAAIGIVFGYLPARRAARLDPIEALRHE